jgi:phytoene synthase
MRPNLQRPERATPADLAACREMIRSGSRSFYAASLLLPDHMRNGAYALYAFCRLSDDTVDIEKGGDAAITRLKRRLDAIYAGDPGDNPADRALADAIEIYGVPRTPFDALLEGLAWDAQGYGAETIGDLQAYAARMAGAVGAMMTVLMRARTPEMLARATDLGVAMQLTNVARDVGEDARNGRLYLPRAWMREAGLDPDAWLAAPHYCTQIASVIARVLDHAEHLYRRADSGIDALPAPCRPAIHAARLLYAEIGADIARRRYDSISRRAVVRSSRKLQLVAGAMVRRVRDTAKASLFAPALPQNQFIVDAITAHNDHVDDMRTRRGLPHDVKWVVELFTALDERKRRLA